MALTGRVVIRQKRPGLDAEILEWVREHGIDWTGLSEATGVPHGTISSRWARNLARTTEGQEALRNVTEPRHLSRCAKGDIHDVLELPPRPFAVDIPKPAERKDAKWLTALLYGDTHFMFHDQSALDVVLGIARDLKPDVVVHMGDLLDCYKISKYDRDPGRLETLQDEIDAARTHLHQVAQICPQAERYILEGNHERRLTKAIWNIPDAGQAIVQLNKVKATLNWPTLLDLASIGFDWIPHNEQSRTKILPKWILVHGSIVRKHAAYTARGEWERYGRSGSSGHTHRAGTYKHCDHNGWHTWIETGCTCSLDPEYMVDPNWQQGCVVLTFRQSDGAFQAETIDIINGNAIWRKQEYTA